VFTKRSQYTTSGVGRVVNLGRVVPQNFYLVIRYRFDELVRERVRHQFVQRVDVLSLLSVQVGRCWDTNERDLNRSLAV